MANRGLKYRISVPYLYMWLADHWHKIETLEEIVSLSTTPLRITFIPMDSGSLPDP